MIDRKIAPQVHGFEEINFLQPEHFFLDNGIEVYSLNAGSQELVKVDIVFKAGAWYQPSNLVAGLTNGFMNQGSMNFTAQKIAETTDSLGAYLQPSADQHFGNFDILTLNKHIEPVLKVAADVVKYPVFPEKEVNAQIIKRKQQFLVENSKVKVKAQKAFSRVLFGDGHPYSNTNVINDYDTINRELFIGFHSKNYLPSRCRIVVAGKFGVELPSLLNRYFGGNDWLGGTSLPDPEFSINPSEKKAHFVEKPDALQSAIRVGRQVVNRNHPDYWGLTILTTILGGYFGSRLMSNIRENKGYTYGIGASVISFPRAAYLTIASEVGADVCRAALNEVYFEMERLQNELVPQQELDMVRNYLMGEVLRGFDGIFAMSQSLQTLLNFGLGFSHYRDYIATLQTITSEEILRIAQLYFNKDSLYEVVAGK